MPKPTVVLVHGAFAESASWNGVMARLRRAGCPTIAAANPLRGLSSDADSVRSLLMAIDGPVVLVGHSYGGSVISAAAHGLADVRALVFVAAFAPEEGESIGELSNRLPGSTLAQTLWPVPRADGSTDLYIRQDAYAEQFADDLGEDDAALGAAGQRPLRDLALDEGAPASAWRSVPSWFIWPELDRNIPAAAHRFMAERAGAREAIEISGASHALPASRPDDVAALILRAIAAVC
ncbi:MAG TPA: alpha/beta hydrolase [Pseudonocardia sp.]